jgi:hypothetical protein
LRGYGDSASILSIHLAFTSTHSSFISVLLNQKLKLSHYTQGGDADEITGDHQCGFRRNRSTSYQIFYIRQILEKKWEYNDTVHQLLIDFKKVYESVRRKVSYNILIEFAIPRKLVELIKMCLNRTNSRDHTGKNLSYKFPIQNDLKKGDTLSPSIFNFALKYVIRRDQESQEGLKLYGTQSSGLCR